MGRRVKFSCGVFGFGKFHHAATRQMPRVWQCFPCAPLRTHKHHKKAVARLFQVPYDGRDPDEVATGEAASSCGFRAMAPVAGDLSMHRPDAPTTVAAATSARARKPVSI